MIIFWLRERAMGEREKGPFFSIEWLQFVIDQYQCTHLSFCISRGVSTFPPLFTYQTGVSCFNLKERKLATIFCTHLLPAAGCPAAHTLSTEPLTVVVIAGKLTRKKPLFFVCRQDTESLRVRKVRNCLFAF